jgi:hypothetical protein
MQQEENFSAEWNATRDPNLPKSCSLESVFSNYKLDRDDEALFLKFIVSLNLCISKLDSQTM